MAKSKSPRRKAAEQRRITIRAFQEGLDEELHGTFLGARAALLTAILALEGKGVDTQIARSLQEQMIALCAGYAALVAAGEPAESAERGADGDFAEAASLMGRWSLSGDLEVWKAKAVDLMREPRNVKAVRVIADELIKRSRLDG